MRFVADLRPELARAQAERYGVPGHGSPEEALARDDVELIVNLTIPAAHAEVAAAALAAGKHVFNEKPIASDLASAEALLTQADAAGLRVGCAPDTFLGPGLQTARRLLESGAIGIPLTASVVFQNAGPHRWHPNPDFLYQPGAGPLFDLGPYYLTALAQAFGPVARVAARGASARADPDHRNRTTRGRGGPRRGADLCRGRLRLRGRRRGQATFSFDSRLDRQGVVEIAGTEATLIAPDPNTFTGAIRIHRGEDDVETVPAAGAEGGRGIGAVDMARAIRAGVPHRADGRLGLHVLDAMLATAASIETAAFVDVASRFEPASALPEDWDPAERTL